MVIGRLAPTPSGGLHLGNARTFLVAWLSARAAGGRIVLRIDDLDVTRVKPGYVEQALADLRWLGFDWDGEPVSQSRRGPAYAAALEALRSAGLVYASTASRRELSLAGRAPHDGEEGVARADVDRAPAWRFRAPREAVEFADAIHGRCAMATDDFVVNRADGIAAYQLATGGPTRNACLVERNGWHERVALGPGERREVRIPGDVRTPGRIAVTAEQAFRPSEFDPRNADNRRLGCRLEFD